MCMANQLGNYAPTMALVTNCDCHSYVGALRHSMPMITVLNKWIAIFSLIHVFSYAYTSLISFKASATSFTVIEE